MKFHKRCLLFLQLLAAIDSHVSAQSNIISWGISYGGWAPVVTDGVSSVSCGTACVAVMKDGSLVGWGFANRGGDPPAVTNASRISCGSESCVALLNDGTVLGWGAAHKGGINPGITNAISISCGMYYCAAVKKDGTLSAWGETTRDGADAVIPTITNASTVSCCGAACAVLKNDGTVTAFGDPWHNGKTTNNNNKSLESITQIKCGDYVCAAIKDDGSVIAWGDAPRGANEPAITNASQVTCSRNACAALLQDGSVVTWGNTALGGSAPVLTNVIAVDCSDFICAALLKDGSLHDWGNTDGLMRSNPGTANANAIECGYEQCVAYYSEDIAGGGGDPHYFGFGGTFFTWQAHCDAILLSSPQENEDVDIEVHVRMTKVRKWSKIDAIAFASGDNTGEINSDDGKLVLNGRQTEEFHNEVLSIAKSKIKKNILLYTMRFPKEKKLEVKVNTRSRMIYVTTSGRYPQGTQGLLGSPRNPGLISRDGIKMQDKEVNAFGESWQVKDTDRHLFREERAPQFPSKCLYDMKQIHDSSGRSRALREIHRISREEATIACEGHNLATMRKFCVDDVMMTGDMESAKDDFYG